MFSPRQQAGINRRHGERGQAIIESMFCMFVLLLVLFGFMHIFHTAMARMVTSYASMSAARSSAVGFVDNLVIRRARCAAIPASGRMTFPGTTYATNSSRTNDFSSPNVTGSVGAEKALIERYIPGDSWMEYEFWYGDSFSRYRGEESVRTRLNINHSRNFNTVSCRASFDDYPVPEAMRLLMPGFTSFDLRGEEAFEVNYTPHFLDAY